MIPSRGGPATSIHVFRPRAQPLRHKHTQAREIMAESATLRTPPTRDHTPAWRSRSPAVTSTHAAAPDRAAATRVLRWEA